MPESDNKPNSPFLTRLVPLESAPERTKDSLFLLDTDPEKVVRRLKPDALFTPGKLFNAAEKTKMLTAELQSVYGIHTSSYDIELDLPEVFIVTDKIHGHTIDDDIPTSTLKDNLPLFDSFYTSLTAYIGDKFEKGGDMLVDIEPQQFMFGHTKQDPEDRVYWVDLEPLTTTLTPFGGSQEEKDKVYSNLFAIYLSIKSTEHKTSETLTNAREELLKRVRVIPPSTGYYTDSIQPILEDLQKAA